MRSIALVPLLLIVGCGAETTEPTDSTDAGSDVASSDAVSDAASDALDDVAPDTVSSDVATDANGSGDAAVDGSGDAEGSEELPPDNCDTGETYVWVISQLLFGREEPRGTSPGINLDDHVSRRGDDEGCNHQDMVDPGGEPGIDNNFARLLPALETVGGDAVEGLIQDAINAGELLIVLEVSHVDDLVNDRCVDVTVLRGSGAPLVSSSNRIVEGQTFDRALDLPSSTTEAVQIVDGQLQAGPFDLTIPVSILGTSLSVTPRDSRVRLELGAGEGVRGVLGGGILLTEIEGILTEVGGETVVNLARDLVGDLVDLSIGGESCDALSATLVFEATPAFLFE